jgi:hypothetical protein
MTMLSAYFAVDYAESILSLLTEYTESTYDASTTDGLRRMSHMPAAYRGSILAAHCNQPYEKVEQDTHRDYFMTAEEAREYGIVDHVLTDGACQTHLRNSKEQLRNDDDTAASDRRRAQAGDGHPAR